MQKSAHFRVDPKLAHVLGESYTSSEKLVTQAAGKRTRVLISKTTLTEALGDLESRAERDRLADKPARRGRAGPRINVPLPPDVADSDPLERGQRLICVEARTNYWDI